MGLRVKARMRELSRVIPEATGQVCNWLMERGIQLEGPSIVRYHTIDMDNFLDIEMGVLVNEPVAVAPGERVSAGVLPAGRYAALVYTGVKNGVAGNRNLLEWGASQGLAWDRWDDPNGDAFGARYETLLTDPIEEPDKSKWKTDLAIRLADGSPGG